MEGAPVFDGPATQFILRCGGCHGTTGNSPPESVPVLSGLAGWFLCSPEGRDYIARLPNVTRVPLSDADLADVLNFVAFDLGRGTAPLDAEPFTEAEIARQRSRPLGAEPLKAYRQSVVQNMVAQCGAPAELLVYGAQKGDFEAN